VCPVHKAKRPHNSTSSNKLDRSKQNREAARSMATTMAVRLYSYVAGCSDPLFYEGRSPWFYSCTLLTPRRLRRRRSCCLHAAVIRHAPSHRRARHGRATRSEPRLQDPRPAPPHLLLLSGATRARHEGSRGSRLAHAPPRIRASRSQLPGTVAGHRESTQHDLLQQQSQLSCRATAKVQRGLRTGKRRRRPLSPLCVLLLPLPSRASSRCA
jgi:hypothetical protein